MKLYYREVGEPDSPPIIIVHGIFGSSDNWLTVSKAIAAHGYRVILPDQRNHGQSPRADALDYPTLAADIGELITDLSLVKLVLVGHSMGGKTLMQYVMDYPGTFSKLVVVDIAPKFYPIHHAELVRGLSSIDLTTLKGRTEADTRLTPYEPIPTVRQFLLKNLYRTEQGQFAWRLNLPVIARELHGVGAELTNPHVIMEPTLFIRGSESPYILDEDIANIRRIFSNARIETIEGAGHWVQAEKPLEFVQVLIDFLKI